MHVTSSIRRGRLRFGGSLAVVLCMVVTACVDAPTGLAPLSEYQAMWAAVLPSERLPHPSEWLEPGEPSEIPNDALATVVRLERDADLAFGRGDLPAFQELRRAAVASVIQSMTTPPPVSVVADAVAAIDGWLLRTGPSVSATDVPGLSRGYAEVVNSRADAATALASADSLAAATALMEAAERIREWTPTLVSLHVIERAELRLAGGSASAAATQRARHLLRGARQAAAAGEPIRAVQRALYAVQLAGGQEMLDPTGSPDR